LSLTGIQEANRINIHEVHFIQIQHYPWVTAPDLGTHHGEVHGSKFTAQLDSRSAFPRKLFDFQRHHFQARTRHYKSKSKANRTCLKNQDLGMRSILNFEDFLTDEEKGLHSSPTVANVITGIRRG
jgi:hypothetical protein